MKIAIEAQRIFRRDKHGMDFVILEVLRQLQRLDTKNQYYVFVAPGSDPCLSSTANMQVIELRCPTYPLWEQIALPRAVKRIEVNLLHCTSNTAPLHCPVPLILTLHDIIYLQETYTTAEMSLYQRLGRYYRRWNIPRIVSHCQRIITVSHTIQETILQRFPQLDTCLEVIYNGYSTRYHPTPKQKLAPIVNNYSSTSYFLFLGNTDPRKNTLGVLKAYELYLRRSRKRCKLIVSGLNLKYIHALLAQHNMTACKPYLVCPGYLPETDIAALYTCAEAFLFPSFEEGFGIPILEAMACGTPVITSNISAMPEIAGEGGLLVDPYRPQEIANALLRLETNEALRQRQVAYGLQRVKQFSWEETAKQYLQLYETVL